MVDSFVVLQLFIACNLGKSFKNQLIYTLLYCMIYYCMIQKWQYINTPKLCIVTPLDLIHASDLATLMSHNFVCDYAITSKFSSTLV